MNIKPTKMTYIINYIRRMFCKHEFQYDEKHSTHYIDDKITRQGTKVSRTCKKCGWHKSYWKF